MIISVGRRPNPLVVSLRLLNPKVRAAVSAPRAHRRPGPHSRAQRLIRRHPGSRPSRIGGPVIRW
ncbi:MAG: hypothetical protein CMG81_04605, partial [Marinobacter sp.]|nr:hypothetical protein [Marinobacter sp.]